jgi:tetratricopeptide (TPR) repeat protein
MAQSFDCSSLALKSIAIEAVSKIHLIENHDAAYVIWRDAGVKDRILIHVDSHHDMWWCESPELLNIANFVSQALRDKMVRAVFWVVPDQSLATPQYRSVIARQLRNLSKDYPNETGGIRQEKRHILATALGKQITVCSLASLPRFEESVLLDIDIDFMVIRRVTNSAFSDNDTLPWCWPNNLLLRLQKASVYSDLITIAYSVEGGYTPLQWKYLGDELALRLRNRFADFDSLRGMECIGEAACAAASGDLAVAEASLTEAMERLPCSAAPSYHLAYLYGKMGRKEEGMALYQQALSIDKTYQTSYSSFGLVHYWGGRLDEAEDAYRQTLDLNPTDASALMGLGRVEMRRRKWEDAEHLLRRSLELDPNGIDACRALAVVLTKTKRPFEAIEYWEKSLRLALHGRSPLDGGITSNSKPRHILDKAHGEAYARLAQLYEQTGDTSRAIAGYSVALKAGYLGIGPSLRLMWLQLRHGQWKNAALGTVVVLRIIAKRAHGEGRRAVDRLVRKLLP